MANPLLVIGQVAPHLRERADAIALCAKIRPVGSVNVEALSKERGLAARRILEFEKRGQELLDAQYDSTHTLQAYHDEVCQLKPGHVILYCGELCTPYIVQYIEATDSTRLIRVQGVREKKMNFATAKPRIFTETEEGAMLLPDGTVLVWLPTSPRAS